MEYGNIKKMPWIEVLIIFLFSLYYILPSASAEINFLIVVFLILFYVVYVILKDKQSLWFVVPYLVCSFLLASMFTLLTDTTAISATSENLKLKQFMSTLSQYLFMYLPVIFCHRVLKKASIKQQRVLFIGCSILFIFVTIITLRELAINPGIIRSWENFSELEKQNIGNYYFVYAIPIIITLLAVIMENKKIYEKAFYLIFILLFMFFVLQAEYTLALIITMVGLTIVIYRSIRNIIFKLAFLFVSLLVIILLPTILVFLANNIESTQMSLRLMELRDFFVSGSADGYNLNGRLTLYGKSILAFLRSPLYGNRTLDFNGHALFLTVLADTGILGGIPFYYLLLNARKQIKQMLKDNYVKFIPIFICLLCIGFTNPIQRSYPVSFSIWFFAPLAISLFVSREENKL